MSILPTETHFESTTLPSVRGVPLAVIRLDGRTQCRELLNEDHVEHLVEVLNEGQSLPPAIVFHDGSSYWLADGFHRYQAAQRRSAPELWCEVKSGTRLDAVSYALSANAAHGLPRTSADKRKAVIIALAEFPQLSSRAIAAKCGLSHHTVERYRPASTAPMPREGADGKSYGGRFPEANRAPGDPAPLPTSYAVESAPPEGPTVAEIVDQLRRADRVAKLPVLVERARVVIASIRALGCREWTWLLAHYLGDADYGCPRVIKRDAAQRQGVKLPDAVLDLEHDWHTAHGLATLGNCDQVAVVRALLDARLVRAAEIVLERGSEGHAGDFLRHVLGEDLLGFAEETPKGLRTLTAQAKAQLQAAATA